ncbi:MAG: hypothetical protein AAGI11_21055 [Pseudomonadota bacterium]
MEAIKSMLAGAALTLGMPVFVQAEGDPATTGWLELVKGSRGDVMGAEVREVDDNPDDPSQKQLVIAIPKASMQKPPSEIEEVRVVGQAPQEIDILPEFDLEYRWLEDLDGDNYGLLIYWKEDTEYPIRLFMHSRTGTIR